MHRTHKPRIYKPKIYRLSSKCPYCTSSFKKVCNGNANNIEPHIQACGEAFGTGVPFSAPETPAPLTEEMSNTPNYDVFNIDDTDMLDVAGIDLSALTSDAPHVHRILQENTEPVIYTADHFKERRPQPDKNDAFGITLFDLCNDGPITRERFEMIAAHVNTLFAPNDRRRVKSAYKNKKMKNDGFPVSFNENDTCINACRLYLDKDKQKKDQQQECDLCKKERFKENGETPLAKIRYLSISDYMALMLYDPITREKLQYRPGHVSPADGSMTDIFNGKSYKKIAN
ncbi:unnamed protein product [Absidia cylindrospora]